MVEEPITPVQDSDIDVDIAVVPCSGGGLIASISHSPAARPAVQAGHSGESRQSSQPERTALALDTTVVRLCIVRFLTGSRGRGVRKYWYAGPSAE